MAFEERLRTESYVAAEDLSAKQYHFVKLNTDGKVEAMDAATDLPIGILQNKPKAGETGTIAVAGVSKLIANAAVNESELIGSDADGKGEPSPGTTGQYIVGSALLPAGDDGETTSIQFSLESVPATA